MKKKNFIAGINNVFINDEVRIVRKEKIITEGIKTKNSPGNFPGELKMFLGSQVFIATAGNPYGVR